MSLSFGYTTYHKKATEAALKFHVDCRDLIVVTMVAPVSYIDKTCLPRRYSARISLITILKVSLNPCILDTHLYLVQKFFLIASFSIVFRCPVAGNTIK